MESAFFTTIDNDIRNIPAPKDHIVPYVRDNNLRLVAAIRDFYSAF